MAHYKLIASLKTATGNINNGLVNRIEDGGHVRGRVELDDHIIYSRGSTTLQWLEYDLLRGVNFDKEKDTYEKNW